MDKFVQIFRHNAPTVQRLAERKFQLILDEQEKDIITRENELKDLENKYTMLELELSQHRANINSCEEISEAIATEVQREFVSKTFIKEERRHLIKLRKTSDGIQSLKLMNNFYNNILALLDYLEKYAGLQGSLPINNITNIDENFKGKTLSEQLQNLTSGVSELIEAASSRNQISVSAIRVGLETVLHQVKDMGNDVSNISNALRNTVRQKAKLENETLTVLHDLQEIRRLGRELNEKQTHISELNRHRQLLMKKSRQHRKQLEILNGNIKDKKAQTAAVQEAMDRHLTSALRRAETVLKMLPDLDTDSCMSRTGSACSRSNLDTPYTYNGAMESSLKPGKTEHNEIDDNANESGWPNKYNEDSTGKRVEAKNQNNGKISQGNSTLANESVKSKQFPSDSKDNGYRAQVKRSYDSKQISQNSHNVNRDFSERKSYDKTESLGNTTSSVRRNESLKSRSGEIKGTHKQNSSQLKGKQKKDLDPKHSEIEEQPVERQSSFDKKIALLDKWYKDYSEKHEEDIQNIEREEEEKAKNERKIQLEKRKSFQKSAMSSQSSQKRNSQARVSFQESEKEPTSPKKSEPFDVEGEPILTARKRPRSPSTSSSDQSRGSSSVRVLESEVTPIPPDMRTSIIRLSKDPPGDNLPSLKKHSGRQTLPTNKINFFVAKR